MDKSKLNFLYLGIFFILNIILYFIFKLLNEGSIINLYPQNKFNDEKYIHLWKETTSYQRYTFSDTYYKFIEKLNSHLISLSQNKRNNKINITIKKYINETYITSDSKFKYSPFFLVSLIPNNINITNKNKLLIAAHFDGHNLTNGGTAYDDQVNIISMLGTIEALLNNDYNINSQIDFLFDGLEEIDLIAVQAFQNIFNHTNSKYDYLNLEGMGSYTPYIFILKNNLGSKNIQKALSKIKGNIFLPLNYLYDKNISKSITDCIIFNEEKWKGGMNVFLGLSSHYHSKYDKIYHSYHLLMAGHQLLEFTLNYFPFDDNYNSNVFSFGICPFCVIVNDNIIYSFIPIFFVVIILLIYLLEKENFEIYKFDYLKGFFVIVLVFIFFVFQSFISYIFNPCSFASNQFFFVLISFSGFSFFYFLQIIFKVKKWDLIRLFLDSFIMLISITTDLSIPFLLVTIFSLLFYLFNNFYLKFCFAILRNIIMIFYYSVLIPLIMQFTTNLTGYFADIFLYSSFCVFTFNFCIIGFALFFNENNEEEDESIEKLITNNDEKENSKNSKDNKKLNFHKHSFLFNFIIYFFPIFATLIIIFKSYPYGEDFTIRGQFMEIIEDNIEETQFIFFPNNGINYLKKVVEKENKNHNNKILYNENYTTSFNKKGNAFILTLQNETLPCNLNKTLIQFENNNNELYFKFKNINSTCISAIFIVIDCNYCIVEGNKKKYIYENNDKYIMSLRVGKKENETINDEREIDTLIKVNSTDYKIDIIYNSRIVSHNYFKFQNSFSESAVMAQSGRAINDVIYIYHFKK